MTWSHVARGPARCSRLRGPGACRALGSVHRAHRALYKHAVPCDIGPGNAHEFHHPGIVNWARLEVDILDENDMRQKLV